MTGVRLNGVEKSFGTTKVLKGLTLDIAAGSFTAVVGPSGSGKSMLLRMIAGLEQCDAGTIHIGDRRVDPLPPADRRIAMVFQSYALYPHMNVRKNMAFGLKFLDIGRDEADRRVAEAARILQLEDLLHRKPAALSGGQRQRVAIGRAIVREPDAFLFDEPLSNLDAALRTSTRVEIARLHGMLKTTMVYVTHDQTEAMTLAEQIVVMRDGRIEQTGTPMELYDHPANLFVAGFIGSPAMNFLTGAVAEALGAVTLGVRPEHLSLTTEPDGWPGTVTLAERLGSDTYLHVGCGALGTLVARVAGDAPVKPGEGVRLKADPAKLHQFDGHGVAIGGVVEKAGPRPSPG